MVRRLVPLLLIVVAGCATTPPPGSAPVPQRAPLAPISWADDSRPVQLQVLNRVSWGANASSAAEIARLGTGRWLDAQLRPSPAPLPADIQARIDAMTISQRSLADLGA